MNTERKDNTEVFEFTYSASQQEEIRQIRRKYVSTEEDQLAQLRKLDANATKKGTIISLIVGIVSTLVFGTGMCCCLVWGDTLFFLGIGIGTVGILGVAAAYPLYAYITARERERIAPEILRLSDELLK